MLEIFQIASVVLAGVYLMAALVVLTSPWTTTIIVFFHTGVSIVMYDSMKWADTLFKQAYLMNLTIIHTLVLMLVLQLSSPIVNLIMVLGLGTVILLAANSVDRIQSMLNSNSRNSSSNDSDLDSSYEHV